jgi:hypothetical protein
LNCGQHWKGLTLDEPAYPNPRRRVEEHAEEVEDVAALVASVDRVAAAQQANRDQRERYETRRAKREWIIIAIVSIAAAAALGALVAACQAIMEGLRETRSTTAEILAKMDAQIASLKDQTDAMRGQLDEMKTSSAIWRSELTGVMLLDNARTTNSPTGWLTTPKWKNMGKTDVLDFKGWNHLQFFPSAEDVKKIEFSKIPKGENISEPQTVLAGDSVTYGNTQVTLAQAWNVIFGKGEIVSWGYVEYDDIFGVHHSVQHCENWSFQYDSTTVNMGLSQPLSLGCNRRS